MTHRTQAHSFVVVHQDRTKGGPISFRLDRWIPEQLVNDCEKGGDSAKMITRRNAIIAIGIGIVVGILTTAALLATGKDRRSESSDTISPDSLIKVLSTQSKTRPLILQVGFQFLYEGGHINGAIWAGPASTPEGLQKLQKAAKNISSKKAIVIYCGCCPWPECPNIKPSYELLKRLGFENIKMLYLLVDFAHDWIDKGYPTVK